MGTEQRLNGARGPYWLILLGSQSARGFRKRASKPCNGLIGNLAWEKERQSRKKNEHGSRCQKGVVLFEGVLSWDGS